MDETQYQYLLNQLYGVHGLEKWSGGDVELGAESWAQAVSQNYGADDPNNNICIATFGAGCFWGTEKYFAKDFAKLYKDAIIATKVGYMNPVANKYSNPTYEEVCIGYTGHIEVAHILYDKTKTTYE